MVASMLRMLLVAVCMKMETMMERRTMIRISMCDIYGMSGIY